MGARGDPHRPGALREQRDPGTAGGLARGWGEGQGPRAVVACPPDELHDLPLLIFGIVLNRSGWRVDYFGASTPIEELVRAVGRSRPELVVVAATTTDRFTAILAELAQLAAVAPLALAGAGATQRMADEHRCPAALRRPRHRRPAPSAGPARRGGMVSGHRPTDRPSCGSDATSVSTTIPRSSRPRGQGPVIPLFVLDDVLLRTAGRPRLAYLLRTLRALDAQLREHRRRTHRPSGTSGDVVASVVAETGAAAVHICADFAPYGAQRDERVVAALGEVPMVATGSPYAVAPDQIRKPNGDPYQVFAPFYRSWVASGWDAPARFDRRAVEWLTIAGEAIPDDPTLSATLPDAGEIRRP